MASKIDLIDEALNEDEKVVEVTPPESKKAEKKAVTGKTSMTPPHQERHGPRQDAHAFIHPGSRQQEKVPGPNATCSATSPRAAEKRRPPIPDIWDGPDARREGIHVRQTTASAFLSGLRPSPRFRVLLRVPALRERNCSIWQPPIRPFHV
jgi:hypothetical protein